MRTTWMLGLVVGLLAMGGMGWSAPAGYAKLWADYQRHVAQLAQEREQSDIDFFQREVIPAFQRRAAALEGREAQTLEALRARAGGRKLSFDGDALENQAFVCTSDVSLRIFTALLKDGVVAPADIVGHLGYAPTLMTPGWLALVRRLRAETPQDQPLWKRATVLLYQAGADRDACRPLLQRWAMGGDYACLCNLLHDIEPATSLQKAVDSAENRALVRAVLAGAPSPAMKAVCAAYYGEIGEAALAEPICLDVLQVPYQMQTRFTVDSPKPPAADEELYMARHGCGLGAARMIGVQHTLFYLVRTERAFTCIFDRARAERPTAGSIFAEWDWQDARSLISAVKHFDKQHKAQVERQ